MVVHMEAAVLGVIWICILGRDPNGHVLRRGSEGSNSVGGMQVYLLFEYCNLDVSSSSSSLVQMSSTE